MSRLRDSLGDYLTIRRALGYKLERAEKLLDQFIDYLEALDVEQVTVERALAWARLPAGGVNWFAFRLSVVRGFAAYLHALDPAHEVPPADLLPRRPRRATPYLYSEQEITALIGAASGLRSALRVATYQTLIVANIASDRGEEIFAEYERLLAESTPEANGSGEHRWIL